MTTTHATLPARDRAMTTYHLDPRKAGTGAAPDVAVYGGEHGNGGRRPWVYMKHPDNGKCDAIGYFATEADALRAARQAAGFGDVAEQPCAQFVSFAGFDDTSTDPTDDCTTCRWTRDAHGVRWLPEDDGYTHVAEERPCDDCGTLTENAVLCDDCAEREESEVEGK